MRASAGTRVGSSVAVAVLLAFVVAGVRPTNAGAAAPYRVEGASLPAGTATISRPIPAKGASLVESPDERFLADRDGRVVLLRGENVISAAKYDPLHVGGVDEASIARLSDDFGFNVSRHLVFWAGIEPQQGVYDESYFDRIRQRLDWYAAHGVYVFLDFHQDIYSGVFGGDGAPPWAVYTDGLTFTPPPPGAPWWLATADPAVQRAYRYFWDPELGHPELQEHYFAAMRELVKRFHGHPAVIGYDIMNEPAFSDRDLTSTIAWAYTARATGDWRQQKLIDFTQEAVDTIRAEDPDGYIFYEPTSLVNADLVLDPATDFGGPFPGDLDAIDDPRPGPSRLVYAPHAYSIDVDAGTYDPATNHYPARWEAARTADRERFGGALFMGEFGAGPGFTQWFRDLIAVADRNLMGFTYWSYDPGVWGITNPDGSEAAHAKEIARPYPQAVAGIPDAFTFDPETSGLRLDLHTRPGVTGPTEVYVGAKRWYQTGWEVTVAGGSGAPVALSYDATREVLLVDAPQSAAGYTVCVTAPGGTCPGGALPPTPDPPTTTAAPTSTTSSTPVLASGSGALAPDPEARTVAVAVVANPRFTG